MTNDLYDRLRSEIVTGRLTPGAPLVETELAIQYGTSRTPVRESLRRLEQDGLVERGERGMQVRSRSPEEILEIYEVRIGLEGWVARTAAERRTSFDLALLEERHARMVEADSTSEEVAMALNNTFHEAIWSASHNQTLVDLLTRLRSHLTRYPVTTLTSPGRWEVVLRDYRQLIDAIIAKDAKASSELAKAHMTAARDIRLRMYASEGSE